MFCERWALAVEDGRVVVVVVFLGVVGCLEEDFDAGFELLVDLDLLVDLVETFEPFDDLVRFLFGFVFSSSSSSFSFSRRSTPNNSSSNTTHCLTRLVTAGAFRSPIRRNDWSIFLNFTTMMLSLSLSLLLLLLLTVRAPPRIDVIILQLFVGSIIVRLLNLFIGLLLLVELVASVVILIGDDHTAGRGDGDLLLLLLLPACERPTKHTNSNTKVLSSITALV